MTKGSSNEFKAIDPADYKAAVDKVEVLELEPRLFAWIDGRGSPGSQAFQGAVEALYAYSYAVRMSGKSPPPPPGWFPYAVGVLQGRWDVSAESAGYDPSAKEDLCWTLLIRQPLFLDDALHGDCLERTRGKVGRKAESTASALEHLHLGKRDGGRFAQILHVGPYDDEPASFARLESGLVPLGERRAGRHHWELYHGDPRRTAPERMRTILRVELEPAPKRAITKETENV